MNNSKKQLRESKIDSHKRDKKKLIPPLLQIPISSSPWIHERMPELLWSALVIGNIERNSSLKFFRYVGKYVSENNKYFDITISGINILKEKEVHEFFLHLLDYSKEIPLVLRPLRLYPNIPGSIIFKEIMDEPVPDEDWIKISNAVKNTFNHQSIPATDCRWVKILCRMLGGNLKFPEKMEEDVKAILYYPNQGELEKVRPMIRALEVVLKNNDVSWPNHFWNYNFISTDCLPEEIANKKIRSHQEQLLAEINNVRDHYINETRRVRKELITHFLLGNKDTFLVTRRETSFGLALYGLTIFTEVILYNTSCSIIGRSSLRSLLEIYISFKFLLEKEKEEAKIWDDFHTYGTGQSKLIYLKLKELSKQSKCIDVDELNRIINEDLWIEFIPINLGQWGNLDLRKMSIYAGLKDDYDRFYIYTSGFVHGTRGAMRESVYQMCINPLHRFHRIPQYELPLMPSILGDSEEILNKILNCLDLAYPNFNKRIKKPTGKKQKSHQIERMQVRMDSE